MIASAASFHGKESTTIATSAGEQSLKEFVPSLLASSAAEQDKIMSELGKDYAFPSIEGAAIVDFQLADMLKKRDAGALASTLEPFAGEVISQRIFGVGVLGMAVSTLIILMLMNGVAFQEAFSRDTHAGINPVESQKANINDNKPLFFLGCLISGLSGCLFPFLWTGDSKAALAVPTSVIGGSLIPIAYFTFLLMMNSKKILGAHRPKGMARLVWNLLMIFATSIATLGSVWVLEGKTHAPGWMGYVAYAGLAFLVVLFVVGTFSFVRNERRP